jgi:SagB-type dehydrogenase family enzyme
VSGIRVSAASPAGDTCWELFHENSKISPANPPIRNSAQPQRRRHSTSFATELYPAIALPDSAVPIEAGLTAVLARQGVPARLVPAPMTLPQLATLLHCAYGVTGQDEDGTGRLRRTVPSAGAVYPLDILFHTRSVENLDPGLYHYSPVRHGLHRLVDGDQTASIASALLNRSLAVDASMILFITAAFSLPTDSFGERGYRHALLEAGHVVQNLTLAATGLGFASVSIHDFFDRRVDALLRLDGVRYSTVSMVAIGAETATLSEVQVTR